MKHVPLRLFDLPILIEKLKHTWTKGELNAMIVLKRPDKPSVLTASRSRAEISSFQSGDSITFHIIEGRLMFQTRKKSILLDKGQILTLHENIEYKLTSTEETVYLLTIAKNGVRQSMEN
jgi:hypothetical protein